MRSVLDTSAVVAFLRDEPGALVVANYLGNAEISSVNLQEVVRAMLARGFKEDVLREIISSLQLSVSVHEADDAWAAAMLWKATKSKGSGLGDRTCMALAIKEGVPAVTTDKAWAELSIPGLTVVLAR